MKVVSLLQIFQKNKELKTIFKGIKANTKEQLVTGLVGSARALMMAASYKETKRSQVIVTHNLFQAQKIHEDLTTILPDEEVLLYPANELIAAEIGVASPELKAQRIEVLNGLSSGKKCIVIVPIAGLRRFITPLASWKKAQVTLTEGEDIEVADFLQSLTYMGYERRSMVEAPGEFSVRGGIIDIYPLTEELPLRIELFDTEIDSIRSFSIEDQRSQEKMETISFGPATEYLLSLEEIAHGVGKLEKKLSETTKKINDVSLKETLVENIQYEIEQLRNGQHIPQMFKYMSLFYEENATLLDYLSSDAAIILDEVSRITETVEHLHKEEGEWYTSLLSDGQIVHGLEFSRDFLQLIQHSNHPVVYVNLFLRHIAHTNPQNTVNISAKTMQEFYGQMHTFQVEIERWRKSRYKIILLTASEERSKKLASILTDYEIVSTYVGPGETVRAGKVSIMEGNVRSGFELPMDKIAVVTEKELFKKQVKKAKRNQKLSNAERIQNYSELKVGDYVVHINHGIGKFFGIETLEINGIHKDYLHIKYQGDDKLYVPVEQIDQVQKYVGSEGKEVKVYKLGGTEWKKVRTKVQKAVQDIADDLIKLYAEREAARGYMFAEDGFEQQEFESSFPYEETEDQLRSIIEIKKDMESEKPMDRLLCGDVGYGKTEVAIRAAFKAAMEGKQVAILVPTTILAQQHFETMKERMQDFPVGLGLLNRFRSKKQQTETLKGLKDGTVDIIVGTHRVLSKDINFKNLGLLIIDEEQRFGVTHKEKIKQMKANIDVLTLTATPIPRTLHMSMLGVRDLSVIETPPANRFPVQTYVVEQNPGLVREAIERELARDGQVYVLHNRVEDIERRAEEISMMVPEAKVAVAHGRMNETELEAIILGFLDGQYDVLVSTTIIETGVDIPNVNTLVVDDADRMGLSQLYQLRGRVGRSNRVAYAYFTYKKDKVLTEVAEKRLQAMKEFTELGSGFKIAMRDLSIRGAGNLLGAQQHGFIDSVGFDMYSQMLRDAIEQRKLTPEQREEKIDLEIDLEVDAYIPDEYISDSKQKIDMYKQFKTIETVEEVEALQEEMIDRFGEYPIEVGYLFQVSYIKALGVGEHVKSIKQRKNEVTMLLSEKATGMIDGAKLFAATTQLGRMISLGMEGSSLKIVINTRGLESSKWLTIIENVLKTLPTAKKESVNA